MKNDPKIIAMYLPQYHCIPENNEFWGDGFTDWVTVKKARPLFPGHNQPRVPLNENYYDLSVKDSVVWQAKLAKAHGIYGFGVYHYWFNNEQNLLTKPAEIIRDNPEIDISYLLAWDNGNWKRSWSNVSGNAWAPLADSKKRDNNKSILIPYILGDEKDWEIHYASVRSHFMQERYIKIENKPVFIIFNYSEGIHKMCEYWNDLAEKDGFSGMFFIFRNLGDNVINKSILSGQTLHVFNYEPQTSGWGHINLWGRIRRKIYMKLGISLLPETYFKYDYNKTWEVLLRDASSKYASERFFHGAFVTYDDTPRRGIHGGKLFMNESPDAFGQYLSELIRISMAQNKGFIFLTAWNEWGEGAYLEPDTKNNNAYLLALAKAVDLHE